MGLSEDMTALEGRVRRVESELSRMLGGGAALLTLKAGVPEPPERAGIVSIYLDEADNLLKAKLPDGTVQVLSAVGAFFGSVDAGAYAAREGWA